MKTNPSPCPSDVPLPEGEGSAKYHMDLDIEMYLSCIQSQSRIYTWQKDSITLGYSQNIENEIDIIKADKLGVDIAKRPTGGGIALHSKGDIAYCVVMPANKNPNPKSQIPTSNGIMENYLMISEMIVRVLNNVGIRAMIKSQISNPKSHSNLCFTQALSHEITVDGRKLVGSAQKRGKHAIIQQGAIQIHKTPEYLFDILKGQISKGDYYKNSIDVDEIKSDINIAAIVDTLKRGFPDLISTK